MRIYRLFLVKLIACLLAVAPPTQAAIQHVLNDQGQLLGATGLIVNGALFDVAFVDDSFENAFNNTVPLIHDTLNEALAFGNILNGNVFLDDTSGQFDTKPNLISGCNNSIVCFIRIPYELAQGAGSIVNANTVNVNNYSDELKDKVTFTATFPTDDNFAAYGNNVYAVFSPSQVAPVPEPATYMMFLLGLLFVFTAYRHDVNLYN